MKGTVKWFNTQKGYGFIVGDDGTDYFVHYSNIKVSEFRHLDAGDHVEFDVETNDKGIQAINVVPVLTMSMIKERAARHNMHLEEAVGCGAMGWMRGKFMQEAVPEGTGAMAAIIGLDDASIAKACEEAAEGQVVSPVNFNSPGQVVIAGHKEAVERAGAACKAAGAKRALPLPVSVPSHCALMKPAADKLAVELAKITFNAPTVPVVNNVDVKCETNGDAIRDALVRQLYNPVQWTKSVEYMAAQGVEHLYEVGPGKVLTGLTKRIVDTLTASALNEPSAMAAALEL